MSLAPGTRLGLYDVVGLLGAGGMGEVYRARDTKLSRDVALKILPAPFAFDADRLARFTREAQVLAALNHPNIAQIYGFEDSGRVHALALELVVGPTLADRLEHGPISLAEALPIARQIAEALEAAHEQGIIHRDLKPANIKVRPDGTVKVLDFGLAKALDPGVISSADVANSPTLTDRATQMGTILGTAAYMAPEQARGKRVDQRADVWAFGCVLYEMLTGRRTFEGDDASITLAAVLKEEPKWAAVPQSMPEPIRRLLARCLEKDPKRRLQAIGEARVLIEDFESGRVVAGAPAAARVAIGGRERLLWFGVALALCGTLGLMLWGRRSTSIPSVPQVVRLDLSLPTGVELNVSTPEGIAVSPDGTGIAFIGVVGGLRRVYMRRLSEPDAVALRGTDGTSSFFFSPDGTALALVSPQGLRKLTLADGLVSTVTQGQYVFNTGGDWGDDGQITIQRAGVLWRVPAAGGTPTALTTLDTEGHETFQNWPLALPGGRDLLFTSQRSGPSPSTRIEVVNLKTRARRVIVEAASFPLYASSGHLLFVRDTDLLAVPFDVDSASVRGTPVVVLQNVATANTGAPLAAISRAGTFVYAAGGARSRLVWVTRAGVETTVTDTERAYREPRLASDGRRIVMRIDSDLWVLDAVRATFTRLTSNAGAVFPIWRPDGGAVLFSGNTGLNLVDVQSGAVQALTGSAVGDFPSAITRDTKLVAMNRQNAETGQDIYSLSLAGDTQPQPLVHGPAFEGGAQFSPDGRYVAYASDESGAMEVYLRPYPTLDRRWQVSTGGGTSPLWNPKGGEVFYRSGDKMMAVTVGSGQEPALSQPHMLFERRYAYGATITIANYDVSRDGQRFLMVRNTTESSHLNVALNWSEELKAKVR
jgi:eukaryotic-like serine/threonine-protein kinase